MKLKLNFKNIDSFFTL